MSTPNEPIEAVELTAYVPRLRVACVFEAEEDDVNDRAEVLESKGFTVIGYQFETWTMPEGNDVAYCCWITYDIGPKEEDSNDK